MKKHNYSAGPCILPQEVFKEAAQGILDYQDSGLSIMEISHRSTAFVEVMEEARSLSLELLGLKDKGIIAACAKGDANFVPCPTAHRLQVSLRQAGWLCQ